MNFAYCAIQSFLKSSVIPKSKRFFLSDTIQVLKILLLYRTSLNPTQDDEMIRKGALYPIRIGSLEELIRLRYLNENPGDALLAKVLASDPGNAST